MENDDKSGFFPSFQKLVRYLNGGFSRTHPPGSNVRRIFFWVIDFEQQNGGTTGRGDIC